MNPLVSVITIFFNAQRFLREAIESVLAQTHSDWELLLVDDGSTDGSTQLARQMAADHPTRIFYLEHEGHQNRGMSASRNLGVSQSRGDFIAFLDSDDVWVAEKLEQQLGLLTAFRQAMMLCGSTLYWHSWTGNAPDQKKDKVIAVGENLDAVVHPPELLLGVYPLGNAAAPSLSNVIFRKEIIKRVGGFEEAFWGIYEDQAFLAKVYLEEPVYISRSVWDRYRIHSDSCMAIAQRKGQLQSGYLHYLDWLEGYLKKRNVTNQLIWDALQKARWRGNHPILAAASPRRALRWVKRSIL